MPSAKFSLKDSDKMIRDTIEEFFAQHNFNYDYKQLVERSILGDNIPDNIPQGYHRMPDGSLMLNSEMQNQQPPVPPAQPPQQQPPMQQGQPPVQGQQPMAQPGG